MKRKLLIGALCAIALLAGLSYALYETKAPETVTSQAPLSYEVPAQAGVSVYDAMNAFASSSAFSFKAKYYDGLGYFIEEIGGKKNAGGYYWTLYVNGKYSEKGASQTMPGTGDIIEWRYEKK